MKTLIPLIVLLSDTTIEITTPRAEIELPSGHSLVIDLPKDTLVQDIIYYP